MPAAEVQKLLPQGGKAAAGTNWNVDKDVATQILTHFYPQTENNDVGKNKIERINLRAAVVSTTGGVARARLDGDLRMRHPFYHKDTPDMVDATVVGYVDFEPGAARVRELKLTTATATYVDRPFDVGVELVH